jgi:dUTP pyrophosphatase
MTIEVPISRVGPVTDLSLPVYMTAGSSGMDVRAALSAELDLEPGAIMAVPTGLAVAVPEGWEIQVRPRSGLAFKHGVTVVNAPGTIDADYRGEIRVGLVNLGRRTFTIRHGDRIAQLVLCAVGRASWHVRDTLDRTSRGGGGFGSTGVR